MLVVKRDQEDLSDGNDDLFVFIVPLDFGPSNNNSIYSNTGGCSINFARPLSASRKLARCNQKPTAIAVASHGLVNKLDFAKRIHSGPRKASVLTKERQTLWVVSGHEATT